MLWDLIQMVNLESMTHIFSKSTLQYSQKRCSINSLLMSDAERCTLQYYVAMELLTLGEATTTASVAVATLVLETWLLYSVLAPLTLKATTNLIFNKLIVARNILLLSTMQDVYLHVVVDSKDSLVLVHLLMSQLQFMLRKSQIKLTKQRVANSIQQLYQ